MSAALALAVTGAPAVPAAPRTLALIGAGGGAPGATAAPRDGAAADLGPGATDAQAPRATRADVEDKTSTAVALTEPQRELVEERAIYGRRSQRTGQVYWYGDFRGYCDVGGKRIPLVAPEQLGKRRATSDLETAVALYDRWQAKLDTVRSRLAIAGLDRNPQLGPFVVYHLTRLRLLGTKAPATLQRAADALTNVVRGLKNPRLLELTVPVLEDYVIRRRGERASERTIRNELMSLSRVCRYATALELLDRNPVSLLPEKPSGDAAEADCLARDELAAFLDAAVEEERAAAEAGNPVDWLEVMLMVFAYTGGRLMEVLGLDVADLDLERGVLRYRHNAHRRLKRRWHIRSLELPPVLVAALRRYLECAGITTGLVFPTGTGGLRKSLRGPFARALARVPALRGRKIGRHTLRHTFATLALQTRVRGADGEFTARSSDEVARLLGHRTAYLVERVYRHVIDCPDYRAELGVEHLRRMPASRLQRPEGLPAATRDPAIARGALQLVS